MAAVGFLWLVNDRYWFDAALPFTIAATYELLHVARVRPGGAQVHTADWKGSPAVRTGRLSQHSADRRVYLPPVVMWLHGFGAATKRVQLHLRADHDEDHVRLKHRLRTGVGKERATGARPHREQQHPGRFG
jgi:hypothetical protein